MGLSMSSPIWTSIPLRSPSHPSRLLRNPGLSSLSHKVNSHWLSILHTVMYVSMLLSPYMPPSPSFPHPSSAHKSVLKVSVSTAALQMGWSVPSFYIPYICISIWYLFFSFWLTSLCKIGSMFIHLIRTDSNAFLFMAQ